MPEDFETPPMSGENVPFKEMEEEHPPAPVQQEAAEKTLAAVDHKKIKKLKLMMIATVAIFAIVIIVLLTLLLKPKPAPSLPPPLPSPSPTPTATPSAVGRNVVERIEALEKQIEALDFTETDLSFPILDFNINFEKKRR